MRPGEIVVIKKRFSAFFHTHLDLMLRSAQGDPKGPGIKAPLSHKPPPNPSLSHLIHPTRPLPTPCPCHPPCSRRRIGVKSVALCGVQTPNCIRGTAVDAIGLDYEVTVLSDATASKSEQVQENNLEGEGLGVEGWP